MRTAPATTPTTTYSLDTLSNEYKSADYRLKEKMQLISDTEIQSFIHEWIIPASLFGIFTLITLIGALHK